MSGHGPNASSGHTARLVYMLRIPNIQRLHSLTSLRDYLTCLRLPAADHQTIMLADLLRRRLRRHDL